jgi:2,3-bisphosphoglycerate-independent phosphoglycerate mutase
MSHGLLSTLSKEGSSKMVLFVMDGLGGLPLEPGGNTELETARTPNLDRLAAESICGLHEPVAPGITPGSGPSHLALFGYDPVRYQVGRGVLGALGINFPLQPGDVCARGNFCTVDEQGRITDRRAGRIPTERNRELVELLRGIDIPGIEIFVETVKEYRFLLVLRGEGLSGELKDTDPQSTGRPPLPLTPLTTDAERTAGLIEQFVERAREALAGQGPANMVLLRGFSTKPDWPGYTERYGIRAAAVAGYPMYRGVARLVGMEILETGPEFDNQLEVLKRHFDEFDFFFLHYKMTDSAGEDGDFWRKVALIEEVDAAIPRIVDLQPDVLVVTGDHSTPSVLATHSWHPVPVLLRSRYCRPDHVKTFGERECMPGGLGPRFPAADLMQLIMANALRLDKFGA